MNCIKKLEFPIGFLLFFVEMVSFTTEKHMFLMNCIRKLWFCIGFLMFFVEMIGFIKENNSFNTKIPNSP